MLKKLMTRKSNPANCPESSSKKEMVEGSVAALAKKESEEVAAVPAAFAPVKVEVPVTTTSLQVMVGVVEKPVLPLAVSDKENEGNTTEVLPSFLNYVNDLRGLSAALSIFVRRFIELEKHLGFIQNAIDGLSEQLIDNGAEVLVAPAATSPAPASNSPDASIPVQGDPTAKDSVVGLSNDESSRDTSRSTLEYLCDTMGSRGVRKYIAAHLSDIAKLREEAPEALKRAPNLAKLVLDCIGRFYLQGRKGFCKDSPMIAARQTSILILEFFLLSGRTQIEPSVKQEAEVAALAWRKRLTSEGGVSSASSEDARGLLLFVAAYGIPCEFRNKDLVDLIQLSNSREIADAVRQSPFLRERIPDVIQGMIKSGMSVAAVDTSFTFGLEDKFPPQAILTSFLRESKEAWKKARGESQGEPVKLKEANEKQLGALKSIIRCLEEHKIDPMVLAGWNISLKAANLEKDILDLDKKIGEKAISKRKIEELEPSKKLRPKDGKRLCATAEVSPQVSSTIMQSQDQSMVCPANGKSLYGAGFFDGYSGASPITKFGPSGTKAGILPGAILGNMFGGGSGVLAGVLSGRGTPLPSVTVSGIGGGLHLGDGAMQLIDNGIRPVWHSEIRHNFTVPPPSAVRGVFGPTLSLDQGFLGQPSRSLGVGNWSSGTDLYQFADTVLESESNCSGSSQTSIPRVAAAAAYTHRSSFLH